MTDIVCPQCRTEISFDSLKNTELPKCSICGKILVAEVAKFKDTKKLSGNLDLDLRPKSDVDSRLLGRKLDKLGDDDLFGELEPFDLEGDERTLIEEEIHGKQVPPEPVATGPSPPKTIVSEPQDDFDELDDEAPVFKNPMETSNLMKKLKDDHDLFESLDK